MAKKACKDHMDFVGLLGDHDRRDNEFLSLDMTKPSSSWMMKLASASWLW